MKRLICAVIGHQWFTTVIPGLIICKRCLANFRIKEPKS